MRKILFDRAIVGSLPKLFIQGVVICFMFNSCAPSKIESAKIEEESSWPLTSYNFGRLEELTISGQIELLSNSGYDGIILKSATEKDYEIFEEYMRISEEIDGFRVDAVFERYNFQDSDERRERWRKVVDRIAGKDIQLWVIFGKKMEGINDQFIEDKLREIVAYATPKEVEVILYPHSSCYLESAEEALPFIEKIDHPNLKLAFHLYHEVRAGNGHRIDEVLLKISDRLGAVTLAGSDSIADYASPLARDTTTIKALARGTYDVNGFVKVLDKSGYTGSVGIMNFKIEEDPNVYIPRSSKIWEGYVENIK